MPVFWKNALAAKEEILSTSIVSNLPTAPTLPLSAEIRAAYQDLYQKIQAAIDSTMDLAVLQPLNTWWKEVDQVLAKDGLLTLNKNTEAFAAVEKQIDYTNKGLKTLEDQIKSIAGHFAMADDVIAAIEKVLTLVPLV